MKQRYMMENNLLAPPEQGARAVAARFKLLLIASVICFGWLPVAPSQAHLSVVSSPRLPSLLAQSSSTNSPGSQSKASSALTWVWWSVGLLPIGAGAIFLSHIRAARQLPAEPVQPEPQGALLPSGAVQSTTDDDESEADSSFAQVYSSSLHPQLADPPAISVDHPAVTPTTRLTRVDIVEAMIADLQNPDAVKRRKAVWELGQQGDSRAVQPLVNLLVDADSQQRSLVLAALAEISTRTLKPLNRALMLSLQDESTDVRKNAIRDMTRVYELITQASQLLQYAASDSDQEVQETARWALGQLNRLRTSTEPTASLPDQKR